jgi:hypothetical protein
MVREYILQKIWALLLATLKEEALVGSTPSLGQT